MSVPCSRPRRYRLMFYHATPACLFYAEDAAPARYALEKRSRRFSACRPLPRSYSATPRESPLPEEAPFVPRHAPEV